MDITRIIDGKEVTISLTQEELDSIYAEQKLNAERSVIHDYLYVFEVGEILDLCDLSDDMTENWTNEDIESFEDEILENKELLSRIYDTFSEYQQETVDKHYNDAIWDAVCEGLKAYGNTYKQKHMDKDASLDASNPPLSSGSYLDEEERGYILNDGEYYFLIQTYEDGYDYTIYQQDFSEWDGGQLDDLDLTMDEAVQSVLEDFDLQTLPRELYDVDEIRSRSDEVEQAQINAARGKAAMGSLDDRILDAQKKSMNQLNNPEKNLPQTNKERV